MAILLFTDSKNISDDFTAHFQSIFIITSLIITSHYAISDFLPTDSASAAIKHDDSFKCVDTDGI